MTSSRGMLLLDKPAGLTSFQAVAAVKKLLAAARAGHVGTLDRFADGLLPILVGSSTRLAPALEGLDKGYRAVFVFGRSTATLDPEGEVVAEAAVPDLEAILQARSGFLGRIQQVPPQFSAVHVDGSRAYRLARRGESPQLAARTVEIHRLEILRWEPPELELQVDCSKGTYVRALARDLGREAGSCAFVGRLTRTRVGDFRLEEAVSPGKIDAGRDLQPPDRFLRRLGTLGFLELDPRHRKQVLNGNPLQDEWCLMPAPQDGLYALFDGRERLAALVRRCEGRFAYQAVFPEGGE
jgi:tRNA pseudouridine55 synthase